MPILDRYDREIIYGAGSFEGGVPDYDQAFATPSLSSAKGPSDFFRGVTDFGTTVSDAVGGVIDFAGEVSEGVVGITENVADIARNIEVIKGDTLGGAATSTEQMARLRAVQQSQGRNLLLLIALVIGLILMTRKK